MAIAVFAGTNAATARKLAFALARDRDPGGESTSQLDGQTANISEIVNQVGAGGFFGQGRVVIVTDLLSRTKRGGKRSAATDDGAGSVDLVPIIAAVRNENLLILLDGGTSTLPAAAQKALPKGSKIVLSEPPRGNQLLAWLQQVATDAGGQLSPDVARRIAIRIYPQSWANAPANPRYDRPPDMHRLRGEIDKLVCAAHPDPITADHVDLLVTSGENDQLFRFSDAAGQANLGAALPELQKLLDAGEEPARLAIQIAQQAELLGVLDASGRRDTGSVARDIGLTGAGRLNALSAARRNGAVSGQRAIAASIAADRGLKRGLLRHPEDQLYVMLVSMVPEERQ